MIIIPTKWLFHWEYTLFSDIPTYVPKKKERTSNMIQLCGLSFKSIGLPLGFFMIFPQFRRPYPPVQSSIAGWSGTTCAPPCSSRCTLRWNEMEMGTWPNVNPQKNGNKCASRNLGSAKYAHNPWMLQSSMLRLPWMLLQLRAVTLFDLLRHARRSAKWCRMLACNPIPKNLLSCSHPTGPQRMEWSV